jgi:hypothetical protein
MCFIKFRCDAIAQSSGCKIFCPWTKIINHTDVVTPTVSVATHHSRKSQQISSISKKRHCGKIQTQFRLYILPFICILTVVKPSSLLYYFWSSWSFRRLLQVNFASLSLKILGPIICWFPTVEA